VFGNVTRSWKAGIIRPVVFRVRFANGQESFCGSVDEARARIRRRAEHDPPPPGILPAEIAEGDAAVEGGFRVVERYPPED
jgi:hypothetical protein